MLDCVLDANSENNSKKGLVTGRAGSGNEDLEGRGRHWAHDMGTGQRGSLRRKTHVGRNSKTGVKRTWGQISHLLVEKSILGIF